MFYIKLSPVAEIKLFPSGLKLWGGYFIADLKLKMNQEMKGFVIYWHESLKLLVRIRDPSFYPVIMLNRVSLYGTIIKIHKIRSMYPYSEFIQKRSV